MSQWLVVANSNEPNDVALRVVYRNSCRKAEEFAEQFCKAHPRATCYIFIEVERVYNHE